jgi:hypothetical protein
LILIPGDLLSARYDGSWTIGYNARNDEIRDNVTRMRRDLANDCIGSPTTGHHLTT